VTVVIPSHEALVRLLFAVGGVVTGVASTVAGSWISSKIHVYHENRKAHLEEIKQKVLIPIRDGLADKYRSLVTHRSPVVVEAFGVRRRKENISVTEYPNEHGPLLVKVAPDIVEASDQVLFADAKKKHFRKVIDHTEQFLTAWQAHADECLAWVLSLAEQILAGCKLAPDQPVSYGSGYIMQYRLGVFVYRRLFRSVEFALFKRTLNPGWVLEGFDGTSAAGTEQELDAVLSLLDDLLETEKSAADRLLRDARVLEQSFSLLCGEINYAIAAHRLRRKCDLVRFF
jgi:hypothetical protein